MQELIERVWTNPAFVDASHRIHIAWLRQELGVDASDMGIKEAEKLMRAAAILACSTDQRHRKAAFRTATCVYELFGTEVFPFDQALRVVLGRLGNFPSFSTRSDVLSAGIHLPLSLAAEEEASADARRIVFGDKEILLTDFQAQLWKRLVEKRQIALSAPTSAGKSFIIQKYGSELFKRTGARSIVYIVPTRALIAQVGDDLADQFSDFDGDPPKIITVPIDPDDPLPERAIYVMTQERVQLAISAHPKLCPDIIFVDEAHSIADGSRGILLQWVIDDLIKDNRDIQVIFASPIIKNLEVFGRLFGLKQVVEFSSIEPTVAQNFLHVSVLSATKGEVSIRSAGDGYQAIGEPINLKINQTLASRVDKLVHLAGALGVGHSNIIYANGAAEAEKIALQLADLFFDRKPTQEQEALAELAKETVHPNYALIECVKKGVAFHYSNIPTQLRRSVEKAVSLGQLDFLVCTSTLLQGVNLPAKNIFMCMPEKGRTKPIDSTDFWNLAGRAGRLKREFQGNIFLIDYDKWKSKPLDGQKEAEIIPAIEDCVRHSGSRLVDLITDTGRISDGDQSALEAAFVRLFSDLKREKLTETLNRLGLGVGTGESRALLSALEVADKKIHVPEQVFRRSPNISAHKQQRLFEDLLKVIERGPMAAKKLIPLHPRESESFQSYADILALCHKHILEIDTSRNLHRFHALIARKWMQGMPLPQMIDDQIKRDRAKLPRTVIRDTLGLIEMQIRFQAVRLFGCYTALLHCALQESGLVDLASGIPALPLYLEVGASDKTMISFVSLGLSRVVAGKLNDMSARKDLDVDGALEWLRTRNLVSLNLSPLLVEEVRSIIEAN